MQYSEFNLKEKILIHKSVDLRLSKDNSWEDEIEIIKSELGYDYPIFNRYDCSVIIGCLKDYIGKSDNNEVYTLINKLEEITELK